MSGTINRFIDNAVDDVNQAADDVEREIRDIANDVDKDDGTPSTTSPAAQVTRLYDTVFNREPEDVGLTFWTNALRAGADLDDLAGLFVETPEFRDRYGDTSNQEFVTLLYRNALNREPDAAGQAFWVDVLVSGRADREDVVLAFSESAEHTAIVGPVSTDDNPFI
ncbi:MAG: DUF4214 domain-containing protein [Acetobacteraceae bacterium]|nr:DUF4214 domain-containing protein [Acetobacteraceae bacterium]